MTVQHGIPPRSRGVRTVGHFVCQAGRLLRGLLAFTVLLALIAGLPWALTRYVGWPLPDHLPTWDDIQATLLNPMSPQLLLNVLACLCWTVWFLFALDVLRCTIDALHGISWPQVRPAGPLHGLAAALIGTIVLTLLGNRVSHTPPTTSLALTSDLAMTAVVAPLHHGPSAPLLAQPMAPAQQTTLTIDRAAPAPPGMVQVTEKVQPPQNGVHDSLWRIANRIYRDGTRWPDLFALNRGITQPDGRALTTPTLVLPGWNITAYIPQPAPPADDPRRNQQPPAAPTSPPSPPPTARTTPPAAHRTHAPTDTHHMSEHQTGATAPGLDVVTGVFVSLSLATAITAALASARMWRRRRYRLGSGDRCDLQRPIAPVVRALRIAHDQVDGQIWQRDVDVIDPVPKPAFQTQAAMSVQTRVGVRDCQELALNLAATRGLGLLGPGATAAARALVCHLLTEQSQHNGVVRILVPATDMSLLFDGAPVDNLPSTIGVVDSLDAALDEMETALLIRTRHAIEGTGARPTPAALVLLASPVQGIEGRLQAILDNGSTLGLGGILLGQWRPGATVRVRPDGTVSATSPGLGDALTGTRLFILPAADAIELLAVLRDAEGPADPAPTPHVPGTVEHDEDVPRGDDAPDDHRVTPSASAPKQTMVEQLTQLESNRAAHRIDDGQGEPVAPVQLLDLHPTPVGTSADVEPVGGPSPDSPQPPGDKDNNQFPLRQPLILRVVGPVELVLHHGDRDQDITAALTPKQREVLVYLALHPRGARRESLNDAVWPDARPPRPFNSLHNAMSLLRRALHNVTDGRINDLIVNDDGRYHLNTDLVTTDYAQILDALHTPPSADGDEDAIARLCEAAQLYRGDLAEDVTAAWIEPFRESIRRDILDAFGTLIKTHTDNDPETALMLLERARQLDRYNESVYRDIIRIQARLGHYDAITRTLALLTTTLDELDQQPSPDTLNLAEFLQRRSGTRRPTSPNDAAAS